MAPLTWREVSAPDFGNAGRILNDAVGNFADGFNGAADTLAQLRARQKANRSSTAIPILAGISNESQVDPALAQITSQIRPQDMTAELQALLLNARGGALGNEQSRAGTASVRGTEGRAAGRYETEQARDRALGGLTNDFVAGRMNSYDGNGAFTNLAPASLVRTESGNNFAAQNDAKGSSGREGHFGRVQFGRDRFEEAVTAGAVPQGMTIEQFAQNTPEGRAAQQSAENWHFGDIQSRIDSGGYGQYIGKTIGGVKITRDGMVAMAHLGGFAGMTKFLSSDGQYNPADSNGTTLSGYAKTHAGNTTGGAQIDFSGGGVLRPEDVLPYVDANYAAERTGISNQRGDREYNRSEQVLAEQQEALDLATSLAGTTYNQAELRDAIAKSDASDRVKRIALQDEVLGSSLVVQAQTATPVQGQPGIPGAEDATVNLAAYNAQQDAAVANNQTIQLNRLAAEQFNTNTPAVELLKSMGLEDDTDGKTLSAIQKVSKGAGISEAQAAAVLKTAAERGNWYNPFAGSIEWDIQKAVELAKAELSPAKVRAAAEMTARIENNRLAQENLAAQSADAQARLLLDEARTTGPSAQRPRIDALNQAALNFQSIRPIVGERNGNSAAIQAALDGVGADANSLAGTVERPSGSATEVVSQVAADVAANGGRATETMRAQAVNIAREIVGAVTGLSPKAVNAMSRADLGKRLDAALADAVKIQDPAVQAEVLKQIAAAKSGLDIVDNR